MDTQISGKISAFTSAIASGKLSQRELVAMYERDVLPVQMAEMRASASRVMHFETLYLTAGTQPYSQALSILATPADRIVFIATDDALCRESVRRAVELTGLPAERYEEHVFPEPFDAAAMVKEIYCHVVTQGGRVAMDITSGRKVMAAALSGLAAQLEVPQYYLSGRFLHGGFAVNVERMSVPNVSAIVRHMRDLDAVEEWDEMEGEVEE